MTSGCGAAICLAAQPSTVFGSPDTLIERGIEDTLAVTGALAAAIVKAVTGKTTKAAIESAINGAAKGFGSAKLEAPIRRELLHGSMLGALDSFYESETDRFIEVESFTGRHRPTLLGLTDTKFAARPMAEAIKAFLGKEAVTRDVFDQMEDAAKRRAFTVANAASQEMVRTVKRELVRQLAVGADLREFGKHAAARFESAGWTPANASHVETVFRTNVLGSYSGGRIRQMTDPVVLAARPFWESLPVGDGPPRQRKTHRNFVLRATDPFWRTAAPPYGYNCFLETTAIAGPVIGAARALYRGQAVELTTADGRRFAVTANHPVLTSRGMIAAKHVREGAQLVRYCGQARVSLLGRGAQWNEHHAPATAEQVFRALADAQDVELTQPGANDFHGEAESFIRQVEVVGSYRQLMSDGHPAIGEQLGKLMLESPDALRTVGRARIGMSRASREASLRAALRTPGATALALDGGAISSDAPPLHELGGASTADLYALLAQCATDDVATDAETIRQLLDRGAGTIALDEVTRVRKFDLTAHVYDFEVASPAGGGLILADNVVVGNCRCRLRSLSIKQGAGRVQEGSSIRGLPDFGFASGMTALFDGGDLPTTKPANDPPPERERAND
jgi:hypothetical protein